MVRHGEATVRQSEAVRVVRHFLTQLIKMAKCMIYIGKGELYKCYRNCLTASLPHQREMVPMVGALGEPACAERGLPFPLRKIRGQKWR